MNSERDTALLAAAVAGDAPGVAAAIAEGADPNRTDEFGWTPLTWAAGAGSLELVDLLLANGAIPFVIGSDGRTPYLVSVAAGHADVAARLAAAEADAGGDNERISSRLHETRPYCRAYEARALRAFPGWTEAALVMPESCPVHMDESLFAPIGDDDYLFVHRSLTVTRSLFEDELVVFDGTVPGWDELCRDVLEFRPLDDQDWMNPDGGR